MSLTVQSVNPFISGAMWVLRTVLNEEPTLGSPVADNASGTQNQVNVVIGVTGGAKGNIVLSMSFAMADQIASAMLGKQIRTFDTAAANAIRELGSVICGNALVQLNQQNIICDLTPPTLIKGNNIRFANVVGPTIHLPFILSFGEIRLSISLIDGE